MVAATSDGEVIIVYDDNFVGLTCDNTSQFVDSGASFHVTPRADFFTSYTSGKFGYVRMKNEGISKIIGKEDVCLKDWSWVHSGTQMWGMSRTSVSI